MSNSQPYVCKVQEALDLYDSVLKPLIGLMYEADTSSVLRLDDDIGTLMMRNSSFCRSRHDMQLYCSTELAANIKIMKIHKLPPMFFRPNSVSEKYVQVSSAKRPFAVEYGVGGVEASSTVTLGATLKPRAVAHVDDIRTRTEELNFELLMDMDEKYIAPFILNSLFNQEFSGMNIDLEYREDALYVYELAFKQLSRVLQES